MPIYEYRCKTCEKEFEFQDKMNDPERTRCEDCGTDTLERVISWTGWKSSDNALFSGDPKLALSGPRTSSQRKK